MVRFGPRRRLETERRWRVQREMRQQMHVNSRVSSFRGEFQHQFGDIQSTKVRSACNELVTAVLAEARAERR